MTTRGKTLVLVILLALTFSAGWWVNNQRSEARISLLKQEHSDQVKRAGAAAFERYSRMEKTKDDAIKSAADRAAKNEADAGHARAAADGLRKQLASMHSRIAAASRAAVDEYAATAGELLGACTAEYQRVAEAADQHFSNERLLIDAWPR